MARLLTWPDGMHVTAVTWLSGPAARTSGRNTAADGTEQTFDAPGAPIAFSFDLAPKRGEAARIERGVLTAMLSGANACRVRLIDPHRRAREYPGTNWAVTGAADRTWSNGKGWRETDRRVAVIPTAAGANEIRIGGSSWGDDLDYGDWIGFSPFHWGAYMITGRNTVRGTYTIWPRLRKALAVGDEATLSPVLVMRSHPGGYNLRDRIATDGNGVTFVEIPHDRVDQYFSDFF